MEHMETTPLLHPTPCIHLISTFSDLCYCLPKGRLSEAAHEKDFVPKMYQGWGGVGCVMGGCHRVCHGGVGSVGCVMEGGLSWRGRVCHGGWGGVGWGCVREGCLSWRGGVYHGGVGWGVSYTEQLGYRGQPSLSAHSTTLVITWNYWGEPNSITTTHLITWNYWGSKIQLQPHT